MSVLLGAEDKISVKTSAGNTHDKPTMNEGEFQRLLQAAYVLQQHNERSQSGKPESGYGRILAGILEIQEQVRSQRLDVQATASLIVRRIRELTQAAGAAVGMLDHDQLEYYSASGSAAGEAGARAPMESTLAAECLRTGLIVQSSRAESDSRLSAELCRQLGVKALIAVPVNHLSKVVGVLELHFAESDSFAEHDLRTCQLMAALLAESIANAENLPHASPISGAEPGVTDERARLLAALEKIRPQLQRLSTASDSAPVSPIGSQEISSDQSSAQTAATPSADSVCEACGHNLAVNELFCGSCGVARRSRNPWASLWEMQVAAEKSGNGASISHAAAHDSNSDALGVLPSEMEDIVASLTGQPAAATKIAPVQSPQPEPPLPSSEPAQSPVTWTFPRPASSALEAEHQLASFDVETGLSASTAPDADYVADKPATAQDLSAPAPSARQPAGSPAWFIQQWEAQRANIYVGLAGLVLLAVLAGWGTPETPAPQGNQTAATKHDPTPPPPQPELSFLDKMLIDLGMAEAPAAPVNPGNPQTQVWIDVHTALYYCPGADLYGKTSGGRLTTQQDAEQDQFQPAGRRPCN